jgi:hypothetical protein
MCFQPENIVCSGRNGESIKIIDFGTAMQLTSGQQEQLYLIIFSLTFCYMIKDVFFMCFKKGLWYVNLCRYSYSRFQNVLWQNIVIIHRHL